jgi:uncharacterized protein (DUF3084 family)
MSSSFAYKIISALHAALDFSVDKVAEELASVPESEFDATLAAVCRYTIQYENMRASMFALDRCSEWATIVELEQAEADRPFLRMTQSEFEREKQAAKRDRRFGSWEEWRRWVERIDSLRRPARAPAVVRRTPTALEMLYAERLEIIRYPHAMFSSQEEMRAALEQVNSEIRRLGGRIDRRDERTDEEREAVTSIDARLRQARALKSCRNFLAAATIARAVKRRFTKKECEYCFDPFTHSDHGNYCSRSCEKFALRGKYD